MVGAIDHNMESILVLSAIFNAYIKYFIILSSSYLSLKMIQTVMQIAVKDVTMTLLSYFPRTSAVN